MRLHRLLLPFLLCLLLPLSVFADPAFYKVSKGDQQHWLLGSIHAGKPSLYPLPDPIERAWLQSRALVLEVDLTHISQQQWQEMGAITRLVDGKTLKEHVPLALYRRTIIAAGQNGLTENMLAPLRPWFAAITLTQAALERTDFSSALGVDQHFAKQAGDSGKPIIGFETLLEQLGYLASVGDNQTLMLESTLDELPELERGFREVMKAWEEGDEATLINLLKSEMAPPKLQAWLEQTLLAERNHNWLKKWSTLPNESFIVVGALHLYGDQGLLALLEQQGWRITPLTEPGPRKPARQ
ncbi:TPA: TraB/GumN family protein [Aeromonas hydrophila]|uniref:TraB/GumN family protein n=1 Tax=Aeromonas TaxID=642 RepID=UPI00090C386D|nr:MULTISPECIES: TraB/GumN family protein [Aeromonas]HEB4993295.1 TraB/GumN family protein [Aeromonas hydrophila subsp. hydrophila]APJ14343.1 polysaccharide biosynthesis protein GumN [Aeromonas hydrophila]BBT07856.1 conjugative transfer protein GumN [Aeromonas hydrophila]HEB5046243.1 TraB/GumN family protein [Aeromonas hydrophila subsp. hydrophila]HEB5078921.1 TraB/GumN family protein [Aeromonas hydrophila subsp. hydrophila]